MVKSDLFESLPSDVTGKLDVILFNPPYVPTDTDEMEQSQLSTGGTASIASTWAGGQFVLKCFIIVLLYFFLCFSFLQIFRISRDGMEVTKRFLRQLDSKLSPNGIAYVIFLSSNHPKAVARAMQKRGFQVDEVIKRKAGDENLCVLRFQRANKAQAQ